MSLADTVRKLQKDVATALRVAMSASGGGGIVVHTHQGGAQGGQLDHGLAATAASLLDDDHTLYLLASGTRPLAGNWSLGGFNLTAGGTIYSDYYILGTNPAAGGRVRLPNNSLISARNALNTADITLIYADASDRIRLGSDVAYTPGGNFVIGATGAGYEKLDVRGRICLQETTSPSATAGYGKLYVKSTDSLLYFMDDSGIEYDLTAAVGSGAISGDDFLPRWNILNWRAITAGNAIWIGIGCSISISAAGSAANVLDADGKFAQDGTSAVAGNIAYVKITNSSEFWAQHNPDCYWHVKTPAAITTRRYWLGVLDGTGSFPRNADMGSQGAAFRYDTTVPDANWQFCTRDAAGTQSIVDTGVAVAVGTVYRMRIWTTDGGVNWNWYINGTIGSKNTNVPNTNVGLAPQATWITEAASQIVLPIAYIYWHSEMT